ncbi:10005_t:CDS:1, partial [Acaulospora morrowiae]
LSQDHAKLLESGDEYNVIIEVGEAPLSQSYKTHSVILCYRCPFLYKSLRDIPHNGNNVKILNKKHVSTKVFDIII